MPIRDTGHDLVDRGLGKEPPTGIDIDVTALELIADHVGESRWIIGAPDRGEFEQLRVRCIIDERRLRVLLKDGEADVLDVRDTYVFRKTVEILVRQPRRWIGRALPARRQNGGEQQRRGQASQSTNEP